MEKAQEGEEAVSKLAESYLPAVITNIEPPIWPAGSNNLPVTITVAAYDYTVLP